MPSIVPTFAWLEGLAWTTALRESPYGYPLIETSHLAFIVLFAGLVIMMDLRQGRVRERQANKAQIHHDHEAGKDDDAGNVRCFDQRVAVGGLAERSRPGEPFEPREGGDE